MENYSEQEIYDLLDELTDDYLKCFIESDNTSNEITIHSVKQSKSFTFKWLHKRVNEVIKNSIIYILDLNHTLFDKDSNELVELEVDFDDDTCFAYSSGFSIKDVEQVLRTIPESTLYLKLNAEQTNNFINEFNTQLKSKPKDIRKGQFAFNLLYEQYPKLADLLRGTINDPFYNDDNLPNFFNFIQQ